MQGRSFLDIARELVAGATEGHWRTAAGRAYYALLQEALAALIRWSMVMPPRLNVHSFVRLRFSFAAQNDLRNSGKVLDRLSRLRNEADNQRTGSGRFSDSTSAGIAINEGQLALNLLDDIEADPQRRASAIAAIQAAFP